MMGIRYTPSIDMWSLGCILYHICTLRMAFTNLADIITVSYQPIPAHVHPAVAPTVKRLLQADPSNRPSADQIIHG